MKKIKSLFKRNYNGDRLVRNEVVEGCEWVLDGYGVPTIKFDGTCCLIRDNTLFKRYDRKLTKQARTKKKKLKNEFKPTIDDFKAAPVGWEAAELKPNTHTGHWPGWIKVGDEQESKYHREAFDYFIRHYSTVELSALARNCNGYTCELVGPKIQGNPHGLDKHILWIHGIKIQLSLTLRTFEKIKKFLEKTNIEGIVWHHPDGRMCKIKRKDFGFDWPLRDDRWNHWSDLVPSYKADGS